MVKNKLEKMFSKSINTQNEIYGEKLHNNMLTHQTSPADYLLTYDKEIDRQFRSISIVKIIQHYTILVEAKQVTLKEGKGRFAFKRLKQLPSLLGFKAKSNFHKSYLLLGYKDHFWVDSEIYFVPILAYANLVERWDMVSINRSDARSQFSSFRVEIQSGSVLDIKSILRNII